MPGLLYEMKKLIVCLVLVMLLAPCAAKAEYASKEIPAQPGLQAEIPPVLQGRTFALYDEGAAVMLIKERMQELGYYKRMATFDNRFNEVMMNRIRLFQQNNVLAQTGRADEATLAALYSDNPVKGDWYSGENREPEFALIMPVTNSAQWYRNAQNEISFRVTVKNISSRRVITAYEVALYAVDAQGERVHEADQLVMSGRIKPGASAWTTYVPMENPEEIEAVYAALKRVRYEDGTYQIVENPVYDCWKLK